MKEGKTQYSHDKVEMAAEECYLIGWVLRNMLLEIKNWKGRRRLDAAGSRVWRF